MTFSKTTDPSSPISTSVSRSQSILRTVPTNRASDNSREKQSNFAGFLEKNSRRIRPISREFLGQISRKNKEESQKERYPPKKVYWKDVKFRARKKTQKFIQHSSQGNCTCFELQEKQSSTETPGRLTSFFSSNLELNTATQ